MAEAEPEDGGVPMLAAGEDPPGGWREQAGRPGLRTWRGLMSWRTRHGPATVTWLLGKPHRIADALCDGARVDVERGSPLEDDDFRMRVQHPAGAWVHGVLAIEADDAVFRTMEWTPSATAPPEGLSLERDLAGNPAFRARLSDVGFAHGAYAAMCNAQFRKAGEGRRWSCSWRTAGGIVADLRGLGEVYLDFYCATWVLADGSVPSVAEREAILAEVTAMHAALGWRALGEDEIASDHAGAVAELAACEARPEGPMPGWAAAWQAREPRGALDRCVMAARSGRMSEDEFASVSERIDVDAGFWEAKEA